MTPASVACQSLSWSRIKTVCQREYTKRAFPFKAIFQRLVITPRCLPSIYLLRDLEPGLFQAEYGAAFKGGRDLQHRVVVVETATDVGHCHPLLHDQHPHVHIIPSQDLSGNQVTNLQIRMYSCGIEIEYKLEVIFC